MPFHKDLQTLELKKHYINDLRTVHKYQKVDVALVTLCQLGFPLDDYECLFYTTHKECDLL